MDHTEQVDLFYRFLAPNATYSDALAAFMEEVNEAVEAAQDVLGVCDMECGCAEAIGARAHLAKELGDLLFTARGLAKMAGIDLDEAAYLVGESNLLKTRVESGKVIKDPNYREPEMADALLENLIWAHHGRAGR